MRGHGVAPRPPVFHGEVALRFLWGAPGSGLGASQPRAGTASLTLAVLATLSPRYYKSLSPFCNTVSVSLCGTAFLVHSQRNLDQADGPGAGSFITDKFAPGSRGAKMPAALLHQAAPDGR